MDKGRKKYLKKVGAKLVKERSKLLENLQKESNPVDTQDPMWANNYKALNRLSKIHRKNRSTVYTQNMIRVNFNIIHVNFDLSKKYLPIQGYYLECKICGNLLPMSPIVSLKCSCGAVKFDAERKELDVDNNNIAIVKLIAMINHKNRKLTNFLNKLCDFFKQRN